MHVNCSFHIHTASIHHAVCCGAIIIMSAGSPLTQTCPRRDWNVFCRPEASHNHALPVFRLQLVRKARHEAAGEARNLHAKFPSVFPHHPMRFSCISLVTSSTFIKMATISINGNSQLIAHHHLIPRSMNQLRSSCLRRPWRRPQVA
jgi:hypothetical protein